MFGDEKRKEERKIKVGILSCFYKLAKVYDLEVYIVFCSLSIFMPILFPFLPRPHRDLAESDFSSNGI